MEQSKVCSLVPKTLQLSQDSQRRLEQLFACPDSRDPKGSRAVSHKHMERGIVTNPSAILDLLQPGQSSEGPPEHLELKSQMMGLVKHLIMLFPLNAKSIYEEAQLSTLATGKTTFLGYLLHNISLCQQGLAKTQSQADRIPYLQHIDACTSVFSLICAVCTLRTSELKLITNSLAACYYEERLSTALLGHSLRLLDTGLQERNLSPHLFFIDNSNNEGLRVLFASNKWPFAKGMTVFLWLHSLHSADCRLLWLRTQDSNQIVLRLRTGRLVIESSGRDKADSSSTAVAEWPMNLIVCVGVELQPVSEGVFKSNGYRLNLCVNGISYKNVGKVPKFYSAEFITEFQLLTNFIGCLYSAVVTVRPELSAFHELAKFSKCGPCRESLVWSLVDSKILRNESIICIFNAERNFQGLLLNYVSEKNHACFEGRLSLAACHKYGLKIVEIYLPFLYLLCLLKPKEAKGEKQLGLQTNSGVQKEAKDLEWEELFDVAFQRLLQLVSQENCQTDSVLFLLLFLQISGYCLTQSTLNYLYDCAKEHRNFYLDLVVSHLDVHALIARGLKIDPGVEPEQDPVQRAILLFHLQSGWSRKWNSLQGFEGWWSPPFFLPQNDHAFSPQHYLFDPKRESRVEWSVRNWVTKDFCKCFLEPVFALPKYAQMNKYRDQYTSKQCFQDFRLSLHHQPRSEVLLCIKGSGSGLERIKSQLLGSKDGRTDSPKKSGVRSGWKEFSAECLFLDILTVVQGTARVTRDGFIVFSSCHKTTRFNRMCIRSYQHEQFFHLSVPLSDLRKVRRKRFNASSSALELKLKDGREMLLYFYRREKDPLKRDIECFIAAMEGCVRVKKDGYSDYIASRKPAQWIDKLLSNYQYLQWLNEIAGRGYSDMSQYPVLPWLYVADSEQQSELAEQGKDTYRDLTKNMGLQGDAQRIGHFLQKYKNNDKGELFGEYHFGSHYSSSAIIFNFLVRLRPFSLGAVALQSGSFDVADRLFYSYLGSWLNATTSPTDLRELIPELYTLPELYLNINNYDYGLTQDKIPIDNVLLPAWARSNPYRFVAQLRAQFQSDYVSTHIHHWVDLIYGYKQRGKDAVASTNIFFPLTYENCIDLEKVDDENELDSFETQIAHFGQNPSQIIGSNPHPKRLQVKTQWEGKLIGDAKDLSVQKCFLSKTSGGEPKLVLKSFFQNRNAVLGIRFLSDEAFFVLRSHEYCLFLIKGKQQSFLWKEQQQKYELESIQCTLNYSQLSGAPAMTNLHEQVVLIGGFYDGKVQVVFLKEPKYNRSFRFPCATVTALQFHPHHNLLYLADAEGYFYIYHVTLASKCIEFQQKALLKSHDAKINAISLSIAANLVTLCSQDATLTLYNSYSLEVLRTFRHPNGLPIAFAVVTTSPLYGVVFYSGANSSFYVYSINGQFLECFREEWGPICGMSLVKDSKSCQSLVYLNAQKEMLVWSLPFARLKRKIKVKKDEMRASCFAVSSSRLALAGTQDGALHIVANFQSY